MFNKIKKFNLFLFLIPELLVIIATAISISLDKYTKVLLILTGLLSAVYIVIFIMFSIVSRSIEKWNKKVLGKDTDTSALINLSPAQMQELIKGHGIKDPNSDKIITFSEISEVK